MDLNALLKEYFENNKLMQLATVSEGNPWICNVYFVTDDSNNIYWTSTKARRHSKEIIRNPLAAVSIVQDDKRKQALQITGKAYIVALEDAERVDMLYGNKFGEKSERLEEVMANEENGRAYWVLRPDTISFWDEVNFPESPKQELKQ